MFKELGQLLSLMKDPQKIKQEVEGMRERLGRVVAEGDAGAGMVKVRVSGQMELLSCKLTDEALRDRELLEDLIRSAVNQALQKAKAQAAEETGKMAMSMGLPAGLNIPGLS